MLVQFANKSLPLHSDYQSQRNNALAEGNNPTKSILR